MNSNFNNLIGKYLNVKLMQLANEKVLISFL
jgi:hypothetical protein